MVRKFFLFLSDHVVTTYEWRRGFFLEGTRLELNQDGLKEFEKYLDKVGLDGPVYLLIDVTEEELHEELVPKLIGTNRKKIIRQRASRIFRNTPFVHYRFQGSVKGNRRKEHALFVGLTDPETTTPWLNILIKHQAQIAGIWSLPLLALQVFNPYIPKDHSVMLISPNSGGLRQIFVQNGKIKVSRLSHLPSRDPETVMLFMHGEIARLRGYLSTLRLINNDEKLDIFLLCSKKLLQYINENHKPIETHEIHPVDAESLALGFNLKGGLDDENVDILFGQCLLKHRISNHYAQPEVIHRHRVIIISQWFKVLAMVLFACGIVMGLVIAFDGYLVLAKIPELAQKVDAAQLSMRKLAIDGDAKDSTGLDSVLPAKILDKVVTMRTTPQNALVFVSRSLANFDDLWIDNMDWESPAKESPDLQQPIQKKPTKATSARGSSRSKPPMESYRVANQSIRISGRITPFHGSSNVAQRRIEQFISTLRSMPEVLAVTAETMPMDADQNAILDNTRLADTSDKALFVINVIINNDGDRHVP
ncbi:MAG: hypothetical protein H7829_02720 [Magnetococcus sp. THC-1_WYH]